MLNKRLKIAPVFAHGTTYKVLDDSVLGAYMESVKSKYNSESAIGTLLKFNSINGVLVGSNPFMLIHLQESGLLKNSRLAERQDLEKALQYGLDLTENNVDLGIVLKGEKVHNLDNQSSAIELVSQFKNRGIQLGKGRLIPFSALTQREDSNSGYGLRLILKEDCAQKSADLEYFNWKASFTSNEGITRACLVNGRYWDYCLNLLAYSDNNSKTIVVSSGPSI